MIFKIEMGAKVRDTITGFEGTVTARYEYITGCRQYCVVAKGTKKEKGKAEAFDEDRLNVVGPKTTLKPKNNGGPATISPPTKG